MSPAAFYRLCFATLAAVIAAVALWLGAPSYSGDKAFGQKLAPDLLEKSTISPLCPLNMRAKRPLSSKDRMATGF